MCGKIQITQHAEMRLRQRVKSFAGYRSWEDLVKVARYNGRNQNTMTDNEYNWLSKNTKHLNNSTQVRIFKGFAYIFKGNKGHARTLITVLVIPATVH